MVFQMDLTDFVLLIAYFIGSILAGAVMHHYRHVHKFGFLEGGFNGILGGILFAGIVYFLWIGVSVVAGVIELRRKNKRR